MKLKRLKGGSLSGTYLCEEPDGALFVRKEVSLVENREYGFQRWYSQMKRLQRYEVLFPGVFPGLLRYGKLEDTAFLDMEYLPETVTVQEFLTQTSDRAAIDAVLAELIAVMGRLHAVNIPSSASPLDLYIHEEIEQRLAACMSNPRFVRFYHEQHLYFNGEQVLGLGRVLDDYRTMAREAYRSTTETFTHGNITLENILYQPATGRVILIDPYEENVIDSILAEYSQIYQSSNSKYELYNAGVPRIDGNRVDLTVPEYPGLEYFNTAFTEWLRGRHGPEDMLAIKLLEVSQFVRMLPFKMAVDEDKMLLFYALGSHLFHSLREQWA